ncbi:MAG: YCF48-related protein [Ignavibacteriae bacterium]|nr:YCF48-related protein [Ignavibacteriota bacterium]
MKYIYIIFAFITLTTFDVYPQSGWILQSPLPTLTALVSIKFIDNNTGISVGSIGSIIKTTNGGTNWKNINSNTRKYLRYLIFINSTTGFAIGDSSVIIKTTNAGENWSISYNTNSKYGIHCISFINSNTGYAYQDSSNVILKTTNCGNNWISINTDLIIFTITQRLYFLNDSTGFYCSGDYVNKTTNGGINWISKSMYPYVATCAYFFNQNTGIIAGSNGNVLKTTDCGDNWVFLAQVSPVSNLKDIRFIDSLNGYLFCSEVGIVYRTTDKGNNWTALMGSAYSGNLSFDFSDINTGYINSVTGRMIKTTNSGLNWNVISTGTSNEFFSIHFGNKNTGFAVGSDVMVKTTNGGNFWTNLNGYGHFVYVHCLDSSNIIAASWNNVQKSTNAGLNWVIKENVSSGNLETACFINNTGYYNAGTVLGKTTDGGETWQHLTTEISNFDKMFFLNENTGFAGYFGPNLLKTINGGLNWNLIYNGGLNEIIKSITFFDSLNGIFITEGHYIKTTNGGLNWTTNTLPTSNYISSSFTVNFNTWYIAFGNSIIKTTNSGLNWITQPLSVNRQINDIYFLDTLTGYAAGYLGTIFRTTDGGGQVWVNNINENIPDKFLLYQNYPNPFNPITKIRFQIKDARFVTLKIFDILGNEIKTLLKEKESPGTYEVSFNASDLPSGVYFYRIQTEDFIEGKKMILIK